MNGVNRTLLFSLLFSPSKDMIQCSTLAVIDYNMTYATTVPNKLSSLPSFVSSLNYTRSLAIIFKIMQG